MPVRSFSGGHFRGVALSSRPRVSICWFYSTLWTEWIFLPEKSNRNFCGNRSNWMSTMRKHCGHSITSQPI
jgi:hypothetical protein